MRHLLQNVLYFFFFFCVVLSFFRKFNKNWTRSVLEPNNTTPTLRDDKRYVSLWLFNTAVDLCIYGTMAEHRLGSHAFGILSVTALVLIFYIWRVCVSILKSSVIDMERIHNDTNFNRSSEKIIEALKLIKIIQSSQALLAGNELKPFETITFLSAWCGFIRIFAVNTLDSIAYFKFRLLRSNGFSKPELETQIFSCISFSTWDLWIANNQCAR